MKKKKRKIDPANEACARCGYTRQSHALANFAEGQLIGAAVLICPFATWKPPIDPPAPPSGGTPA